MQLVLFDIDGTLLDCGRQVRAIFADVLRQVFGVPGAVFDYDFVGKTDHRIVLDLMTAAGVAAREVEDRLGEVQGAYRRELEARLDRSQMRLLGGVERLLEDLTAHPEFTVGLLTGNWEVGARIKLSRFHLNRYFTFGAFGDGAADRNVLAPVALNRAERATGCRFTPERTVIVGDSILDVACARVHDMAVLAVSTGSTSARELSDAGADWVVSSLEHVRVRDGELEGGADSGLGSLRA